MKDFNEFFSANKDLWNKRTPVHKDSSFYNLSAFREGESVLTPIELSGVGDVTGMKMLHLQCHFGMDSLDWARRGAKVTGVDLSDVAVTEARKLNEELGLDASFVCCNVYDLHPDNIKLNGISPLEGYGQADIIFASYGVVGWLPDLNKWAEILAHYLKPGGVFYLAEFHPVVWMFDDDFTKIAYAYDNQETIMLENQHTYTDGEDAIIAKEYSWNHSLSEVLNALLSAGLRITSFDEYMYSPYPNFRNSIEVEPGKWYIKGMEKKIPIVYSVKAVRQ